MQYNDERCENCGSLGRFNKESVLKITQCFSAYLDELFCDLSKAIMKRLQEQQQKIIKNENLLNSLSKTLLSRSHISSTSPLTTQQQTFTISTSRKRISSFKQAKDLITIQKIGQTLNKMQANLLYLEGSLRRQVNPEVMGKIQLIKSRSLESIKDYSVSCPKRYQCGGGVDQGEGQWSEREIVKAGSQQKQQHTFKTPPTIKSNKMPLINKASHLLHQLFPLCQDPDDAIIIKFHLKKTYQKIDQIISHHYPRQPSSSNVLIEQNHQQNIIPRKLNANEYYSEKSFIVGKQSLQDAGFGQCSIVRGLPVTTTELNVSSIKQNYSSSSSYQPKCLHQADNTSVQSYAISTHNPTQTNRSIQKPKYFQRTGNEHKTSLLKKKLKPQTVKL